MLTKIEEIETRSIPGNVKRKGKATWDGNVCINFTAEFLDFLRQTIVGRGVWKIRRRQGSPIVEVFRIQDTGHGEIVSQEFVEWRQKMQALKVAELLKSPK